MNRALLAVATAAITTGAVFWRKVQADKAEQDLWAEVTDAVD